MILMPPGFLADVARLLREHDVLLIADEVATGCGRTGRMFACEHEQVEPDLLTLGKGLTGGYLPVAATLASERIYDVFWGDHGELRTFFHGHSYTGNPLGCAAALASLEVFVQERTLERLRPKIALLHELLRREVAPLPAVAEVRARGFMVGIELRGFAVHERIGHRVTLAARRRGAIIRPLGDVMVLMPPLSIDEADLRRLVEITAAAIDEAAGAARSLACAA
jgi:adenosylmethionine---8-amino-7-oxononanoate aminotransferase